MLEQPQTGLIGGFYRQVENRPKKKEYLEHLFEKISYSQNRRCNFHWGKSHSTFDAALVRLVWPFKICPPDLHI